jgi:hypothetical protein
MLREGFSPTAARLQGVSRVGIEPTTLGLKGRTEVFQRVSALRKLSSILDKRLTVIPRVIKLWHRLRSRLLTGC